MSDDNARETDVRESDPNGDSAEGLAGGMGVSSERTGPVRGESGTATYGAEPLPDEPVDTGAPEQSPAGAEVRPDRAPSLKGRGRLHGYPKRRNHGD